MKRIVLLLAVMALAVLAGTLAASTQPATAGPAAPGITYGAKPDQGETDDPLVDKVTYKGAVYYIDADGGNDANDGLSPKTAWKSLDQVRTKTSVGYWDTVAANKNTVPPNHEPWVAAPSESAFLFKRGCVFDGTISVHAARYEGTKSVYSENLTFGAYGERSKPRPVIQALKETSQGTVVWTNGHTIYLRNLHIISNPGSGGLLLSNTRGSVVENCLIENAGQDGILADGMNDLLIRNSTISNCSNGGGRGGGFAGGGGEGLRILNSTFVNNGRDQIGAHDIYVRHLTKALIAGNRIEGGSNHGIVLHGSSKDVVIRANDIFGNSNGIGINGGYPEAESFDGIVIEQNVIHDNGLRPNEQGYALLLNAMTDSVVRNNLVYGNRLGSLSIEDHGAKDDTPTANTCFYHNTFLGQPVAIGYHSADMKALSFKNNIVVGLEKDAALPDAEIQLDNNLYIADPKDKSPIAYDGKKYTPAELASHFGQEKNGLVGDPLFVNAQGKDFHLQKGSPAIGKGVAVGVETDLESKPRDPRAPTIGAYEAGK